MAASDTIALHCQAQDDGWLVTVAGDNTTTTTSRRLDRVLAAARPLLERYCEPGGQVDDLDVSIEVVAPPPVAAAVRSALDASHHAANHQGPTGHHRRLPSHATSATTLNGIPSGLVTFETWGHGARCVTFGLEAGAVATSSIARRAWGPPGDRRHHIIDPRTGRGADSDVSSVAVVAASAWWAEVVATSLVVLGSSGLARFPDIEALCLTRDGTVIATAGLEAAA